MDLCSKQLKDGIQCSQATKILPVSSVISEYYSELKRTDIICLLVELEIFVYKGIVPTRNIDFQNFVSGLKMIMESVLDATAWTTLMHCFFLTFTLRGIAGSTNIFQNCYHSAIKIYFGKLSLNF